MRLPRGFADGRSRQPHIYRLKPEHVMQSEPAMTSDSIRVSPRLLREFLAASSDLAHTHSTTRSENLK